MMIGFLIPFMSLKQDSVSPTYNSLVSHKKTQYEEALFKCEEERYEFDRNIETNLYAIGVLEPIAKKIQVMTNEERGRFRLTEKLGGASKSIYEKAIKRIYDKDRGLEVIEALYNNPSVAVPVVLKRLKQKDEEWKRCRRYSQKNNLVENGTKFGAKLILKTFTKHLIIKGLVSSLQIKKP